MNKKRYEGLAVTPIPLVVEQHILVGSNTLQNIEVNHVTVADFEEDASFVDGGFDANFD